MTLFMTACSLSAGGAANGQTVYGPGGLLLNPTASFPEAGKLTPAFLVVPQDHDTGKTTLLSYTLDYGVSDRLEAGVTYLRSRGRRFNGVERDDGSAGGFVKYKVLEGRAGGRPDVAVGAGLLGGGDVDARTAFLALRYTPEKNQDARYPLHFHAGLLYAEELYGVERDEVVPYVGLDVGVTQKLTAFAEVRAKMDARPSTSADRKAPNAIGLAWQANRNLKLVFAYANNGQSTRNNLSFGIGYSLGFRR